MFSMPLLIKLFTLPMTLAIFRLFHIKFVVNGAIYGKSYYRVLRVPIGNHTLAFDWCHI